jgi:hypothetical protein
MAIETSNMTRRDFLRLTAKTAVVSSGVLSGCASLSTGGASSATRAIDIHHHYIPLELIDEVKRNGKALGVEYFPPKDAKDNPFQIQFPKGNRLRPDPRMTEINNRLEVMTKGKPWRILVEALQRSNNELGKAPSRPLCRASPLCRYKIPRAQRACWSTRFEI